MKYNHHNMINVVSVHALFVFALSTKYLVATPHSEIRNQHGDAKTKELMFCKWLLLKCLYYDSLTFVTKGQIYNEYTLLHFTAQGQTGAKPLPESTLSEINKALYHLTHSCVNFGVSRVTKSHIFVIKLKYHVFIQNTIIYQSHGGGVIESYIY